MPPKGRAPPRGKGAASSTKTVARSGDAHVVTLATGNDATVGGCVVRTRNERSDTIPTAQAESPVEERVIMFEPRPVGILDLDGSTITKVGKDSQAEKGDSWGRWFLTDHPTHRGDCCGPCSRAPDSPAPLSWHWAGQA